MRAPWYHVMSGAIFAIAFYNYTESENYSFRRHQFLYTRMLNREEHLKAKRKLFQEDFKKLKASQLEEYEAYLAVHPITEVKHD